MRGDCINLFLQDKPVFYRGLAVTVVFRWLSVCAVDEISDLILKKEQLQCCLRIANKRFKILCYKK